MSFTVNLKNEESFDLINVTVNKEGVDTIVSLNEISSIVSNEQPQSQAGLNPQGPNSQVGGRSMRKSSKKSAKKTVKKECPVKTSQTHKGKDGVVRRLYKRAGDFFVKVKSSVTGKFVYKKVKA